jgi:SpoIID/LytB domain protein
MTGQVEKFIKDQLSVWPEVSARFRALKSAGVRRLEVGGLEVVLQHNPARLASAVAGTPADSLKDSPCFLCRENLPPEQAVLPFEGRKGRKYRIQINPFPIFPQHLVIASEKHQPQSIWHHFVDMLDLARTLNGFTVFYNGPESGASAPEHLHFQACPKGLMPLEVRMDALLDRIREESLEEVHYDLPGEVEYLTRVQEAVVYHYKHFMRGVFALRGRTSKSVGKLFYRLLESVPVTEGEKEPKFNLFVWYDGTEYRAIVVLRECHHTHHFYSDGPDHLTMAPGCADVAGFLIVPDPSDYAKLDAGLLESLLDEAAVRPEVEQDIVWRLKRRQRKVEVGIMSGQEIRFEIISDGAGPQKVTYREGKIDYGGVLYDELVFEAVTRSTLFSEPSFILYGVTIGVGFHWERQQDQTFAGSLKFIVEDGKVTAVNRVGIEDYLVSVISSEMKASASLEFLKAHAVISRSWLLSQMEARRRGKSADAPLKLPQAPGEMIRWWDHDDHKLFDVCADDHCQRYQGLTNAVGENVRRAVDGTWGQVLMYGGDICDARFSKCCGGRMELFSTCWEDRDYPYLQALPDTPGEKPDGKCFCDTSDEGILSQVLNDYDLETKDFYRWEVRYDRAQLSELVGRRTGVTFGEICDLIPVERGPSGRISRLKVVGTTCTMMVGKELMIRKMLSESHLKSSAFDVEWQGDEVVLRGRGWGHGVGLCQIGAAVMSCQGYGYREILGHYYPGANIERI